MPDWLPWMQASKRPEISLTRRLVVGAALWSILVLTFAGFGLSRLYHLSVINGLDRELEVSIQTLIAGLETDAKGQVSLRNSPNDPRFERVYSGRYWAVLPVDGQQSGALFQSRSVWDATQFWPASWRMPGSDRLGKALHANVIGPNGDKVHVLGQIVTLPDRREPVLLVIAADQSPSQADARQFTATLAAALAFLCATLLGAILIQVQIGLQPLRLLSADLRRIRAGEMDRLSGLYPREVEPLSNEVNALLDANREVVERARTHVGNLAHALKTPISVLLNEARTERSPLSQLVEKQAQNMAGHVDQYLKRAQAAARAETARARTDVRPALAELAAIMGKLYGAKRDILVDLQPGPDLVFRGERQDLDEMVGNLVDNACKWAESEVVIRLLEGGQDQIEIRVEDDGPGLAPEMRAHALRRGVRLDETAPGTGLGLAIVDDMARVYGGSLRLDQSAAGGLMAVLRLPAGRAPVKEMPPIPGTPGSAPVKPGNRPDLSS